MRLRLPKISVVVCSYNGERGIASCIEGLLAQSYPADRMEIILVDDGSTDNMRKVAQQYNRVKIVTHTQNRGVQHARNSGFRAAVGSDIIAYLDDDCAVSNDWLENLVAPFADSKVVGVGGRVVAFTKSRLSERFMEASGYGNPEPLATEWGGQKNILRRFWVYFATMYRSAIMPTKPIQAQAVYTANVAYRYAALAAIGGFDTSLRSNEDSDVASRLRAFGGKLMFAPAAVARHRHHQRVWHVVRQDYYRAADTLQYYRKCGMLPPIFPLPILYGLMAGWLCIVHPWAALVFLCVGPPLLYSSWLFHAFELRNVEYVLYAYIQLAREIAILLGFVRGILVATARRSVKGAYALRSAAGR